jgi:hypothetical protein
MQHRIAVRNRKHSLELPVWLLRHPFEKIGMLCLIDHVSLPQQLTMNEMHSAIARGAYDAAGGGHRRGT